MRMRITARRANGPTGHLLTAQACAAEPRPGHRGQPPVMVAGSMSGLASQSKVRSDFSRGPAALIRLFELRGFRGRRRSVRA